MYVLKTKINGEVVYLKEIVDVYECTFTSQIHLAMLFDSEMIAVHYSLLIQQRYGFDCEAVKVEN